MSTIKLYDGVRLADGRTGTVVDIYPDRLAFEVEIDQTKMQLETVEPTQITEVL